MRRPLLAAGLVLALAASADAKPRCSAGGATVRPIAPTKAPKAVQKMHQAIVAAALDCDYARLEQLALAGRPHFDFTFGDEKKPGAYWKDLEKRGDPFLLRMLRIMRLPFGREGQTYIWPAAFARNADDAAYEQLIPLFGRRNVKVFQDYGGYTDVRLAITGDGDWIYCVDGD